MEVSEFIAWKSDNFEFNKSNIKEVFALLIPWYNINKVEFKNINSDTFTGTFRRSRSLKNVLNQLEVVSNYKFQIVDNHVIVR